MQKYEYCKIARSMHGGYFIETPDLERVNIDSEVKLEVMNILGKEGWKVITPIKDENGFVFFKRPIIED
ncbi:MAG: hypothetical protein JEZ06_24105 [Anaerolineaceae bacterium]|nr:hypothetical protein [Anaerolineaceae bacterium]